MSFAPVAQPLGVFPEFCRHTTPIGLKIREKKVSISGDDFDITDAASGAKIFHLNGKALTLHARKDLYDASGRHLFALMKQHLHIHFTYDGRDPVSDRTLFTVKSSFSFGTKLTATFTNHATGQEEQLVMKGDFFDRKAEITHNGVPVGRVSRQFANFGQLVFDQQTYVLTVAPGVDAALLVAICICLDEKANEDKK